MLVLILQVIGREMSVDETNKYGSKCHLSSDPVPSTTAPPFLFDGGTESPPLPTYDLSGIFKLAKISKLATETYLLLVLIG